MMRSGFNNRAMGHRGTGHRATGMCLCIALCAAASFASAESLYDAATFQSLTADRRAIRAGDSLTVLVIENSSASASANTTTSKTGGLNSGVKGSASHGGTVNLFDYSGAVTLGEDFGGKG